MKIQRREIGESVERDTLGARTNKFSQEKTATRLVQRGESTSIGYNAQGLGTPEQVAMPEQEQC
jgi:hypothetical protein